MTVQVLGLRGEATFDEMVRHFTSLGGEVVIMDPGMICGKDHVLSAVRHAERAFARGTARSKTVLTEIIMYCAWERQIGKAMARMRPKPGSGEFAVVLLGIDDPEIEALGMVRDDSILDPTPEKADALGLDDPFLSPEDQAVENVAMVELLKQ